MGCCGQREKNVKLQHLIEDVAAVVCGTSQNEFSDLDLEHICCRVARGITEADFNLLHKDGLVKKPITWVMADDGVKAFLKAGKSKNILEVVRQIGFEDQWLAKKLDDGEHFRLALFSSEAAEQATWEGVFKVIKRQWPSVLYKVKNHEKALKETPFAEMEAQAMTEFTEGKKIWEIHEAGPSDPRYMSTERLENSEGTLAEVRAWLHHDLSLNPLFQGLGYTALEDGTRGFKEYLIANRKMDEFSAYKWVKLEIDRGQLLA